MILVFIYDGFRVIEFMIEASIYYGLGFRFFEVVEKSKSFKRESS